MSDQPAQVKKKQEKVGEDGLTKKERRALKVNEKAAKGPVANTETVKADDTNSISKKERRAMKVAAKGAEGHEVPIKTDQPLEGPVEKTEGKSKAQLRTERRELQEKQRLAKQAAAAEAVPAKVEHKLASKANPVAPVVKTSEPPKEKKTKVTRTHLLLRAVPRPINIVKDFEFTEDVHPAFVELSLQISSGRIAGANARCLGFLMALRELLENFEGVHNFSRELSAQISTNISFLTSCTPTTISIDNAFTHFKLKCVNIDNDLSDEEKKQQYIDIIDVFINEQFKKASDTISTNLQEDIKPNDVIATYGFSSLVCKCLIDANKAGKKFSVVVFDGRSSDGGVMTMERLNKAGIKCTYKYVSDIPETLESVSNVIVGAHAVMSNGDVLTTAGTAMLASAASYLDRPVQVCCESYKFSETAQFSILNNNEMGTWRETALKQRVNSKMTPLKKCVNDPNLAICNFLYDFAHVDTVEGLVTELGCVLNGRSVPFVLALRQSV